MEVWLDGPASINCSDFLLNNHTVEPRLFDKVSVAGKRDFAGRDKGAETAPEDQGDHCRDMTHASDPANSALLAQSWEISVSARVRGGAERTRTPCQARSSIEPISVTALMLQARAHRAGAKVAPYAANPNQHRSAPEPPARLDTI